MKRPFALSLMLVLLIAFFSLSFHPNNSSEDKGDAFISIETLVKSGKLKAQAKSNGGHHGHCINISLENKSGETLGIFIEPGRRLMSYDSLSQDILIVKSRKLILSPGEKKTVDVFGFCCESDKSSPEKGETFSIGSMAPAEWVEIATLIDTNNFPESALQSAVWVVSNNHEISSVHHGNLEEINLLRKHLAKVKGVEVPWYSKTYVEEEDRLFSNNPDKFYGKLEYYLRNNAMVTILVRNKSGNIMKQLVKAAAQGPGKYAYNVELDVKDWPKGDYEVYVYEDYSNLNKMQKFQL